MLAEATALEIVKDLRVRLNADPSQAVANQAVAALDNIFTSGIRFTSREEADQFLGALNGLAMDQKNTAVQYAALAVIEKFKEEEDEDDIKGTLDNDLAPKASLDDGDDDIFDAADQATARKRGLGATLMMIAKTSCGSAAREHALEAFEDSVAKENRQLHRSETETLGFIAANDPAPAVQAKANGILERFNMAQLSQAHHAERHTVTPRKKTAEDNKG